MTFILSLILAVSTSFCAATKSNNDANSPLTDKKLHSSFESNLKSGAKYTVPEGFVAQELENHVVVKNASGSIKMFLFENTESDLHKAVENSWAIATPGHTYNLESVSETYEDPWDRVMVFSYAHHDSNLIQAKVYNKGKMNWVFLIVGSLQEINENIESILGFLSSLKVPGLVKTDLSTKEFKSIKTKIHEIDSFILEAMKRAKLPGLSIGVVENGKVVFTKGYGVKKVGSHDHVDENTLFGIGSVTKSLTALLMAKLVDQHKFEWTSSVKTIYPPFKVADDSLTESLTLENLLCNCTGITPRDLSILLSKKIQASKIFDDLKLTKSKYPYDEKKFSYNNSLFAAAGYIVSNQEHGVQNHYYYDLMEAEIFKALGMLRSTADIDKAFKDSNLAMGHDVVRGRYVPTTLKYLEWLKPFAPAGSVFSSASEMSKYLELEVNSGRTKNGEQFISENTFLHRRKPQTEVAGLGHYALAWIIDIHKGLNRVWHNGSTNSYESHFSFYPDKKLGMVILTNGLGDSVNKAVEAKIFELWFDSKEGSELALKNLKFEHKEIDKSLDPFNEEEFFFNEQGFPLVAEQISSLDHLIGSYHNEYIEKVQIKKIKNEYWLELEGGFKLHILSANKEGGHEFVVKNIPMKLMENSFSLDGGRDEWEYVFTPEHKEKTEL